MYNDLIEKYGHEKVKEMIEFLNNYKEAHGKSINPTTMPYFNGLLTQTLLYKIEEFLMIRDRGKKKWQGFFMPENIKMLKNL